MLMVMVMVIWAFADSPVPEEGLRVPEGIRIGFATDGVMFASPSGTSPQQELHHHPIQMIMMMMMMMVDVQTAVLLLPPHPPGPGRPCAKSPVWREHVCLVLPDRPPPTPLIRHLPGWSSSWQETEEEEEGGCLLSWCSGGWWLLGPGWVCWYRADFSRCRRSGSRCRSGQRCRRWPS